MTDMTPLPCPFCGIQPTTVDAAPEKGIPELMVKCKTDRCPMAVLWVRVSKWNSRALPAVAPEVSGDTTLLDWLLSFACLASCGEDGARMGLFVAHPKDDSETHRALAVVAEPTGDDGEFTAEDAPFLTDAQRANIGGLVPGATGSTNDPAALRAAIRAALTSTRPTGADHD